MERLLVSIFVQVYNTEAFVGECLRSILALRGGFPLEIIVIDDASQDRTEQVIRSVADTRIRYLRHAKTAGAIATANEGYGLLRGDYIARIDSDDRYCPEFLEQTVPVLERERRVGLVYGDIATIDPQGLVTAAGGLVERSGRPLQGNELLPLLERNFIPAPATLMRREAMRGLLPIPADLSFLDWYLTVGITESWDSVFVDQVLADYRIHSNNMHRTMTRDKSGEITIFKVLDRIFANPQRATEKRRWRRHVYAVNWLSCGDKYFGCSMASDARRCYLRAIQHQPKYLLRGDIMRRLAASFFPRHWYERCKALLRR